MKERFLHVPTRLPERTLPFIFRATPFLYQPLVPLFASLQSSRVDFPHAFSCTQTPKTQPMPPQTSRFTIHSHSPFSRSAKETSTTHSLHPPPLKPALHAQRRIRYGIKKGSICYPSPRPQESDILPNLYGTCSFHEEVRAKQSQDKTWK